ncbi:hypothetical protein AKJ57_00490 [candidate division MSBL1 archaeon SCGC-AAA259A05]|uniref:DUF2178 domain-containing protein n=1 Tax=candidate division MSBL1 archaeon SCGC-AAA259A05 TaxID=1698259 RepID=A0A133UBQ8_9EURY|nr:hypothetical protein AKJ57_00490 [candidate division MSBL1 archaeon SCGC-AAA259A05]
MRSEIVGILTFGLVFVILGIGLMLGKPEWMLAPFAGGAILIGTGVYLTVFSLWSLKKKERGEVLGDERGLAIFEKASYRTFQIIFPLEGILLVLFTFTKIQADAVPILVFLVLVTVGSFWAFYLWYRRKM